MQVLKKSVMPDGTKIQIEDWSCDYGDAYAATVALYPIAKGYRDKRHKYPKIGETFRLQIDLPDSETAKNVFSSLISGASTPADYAYFFYYPEEINCI